MSEYLKTLFYNLSSELERHFKVMWIRVHWLNEITLSGYGTLPFFKNTHLDLSHFLNLRVSYNPQTKHKSYVIDCSDLEIYYKICQLYPYIEFKPYELYVEVFKDLIPDLEMRGKI